MRPKDFAHIVPFDDDLEKLPDWADRMTAKMSRAHPKLTAMLTWAERCKDCITEEAEQAASEQGVDVTSFSAAIFDVLIERTCPRLSDKRRNAGSGPADWSSGGF